jgi:hypothetical protein
MNKSYSILERAITLLFTLIVTPWTIVIAIKLGLWPVLLSHYERGIIENIRSEVKETTPMSVVIDFSAVALISIFTPLWLSVYLWAGVLISYLFLLEVLILILDENNNGEAL